jgi:hypothetical protein
MLANKYATELISYKLLRYKKDCFQNVLLLDLIPCKYVTDIRTRQLSRPMQKIGAGDKKNFWFYLSHLPNPSVNLWGPHQDTFNNSN